MSGVQTNFRAEDMLGGAQPVAAAKPAAAPKAAKAPKVAPVSAPVIEEPVAAAEIVEESTLVEE